ncbi:mRNA capping enzyme, catalytic domain protein [Dictyocaulus viviparus]|uniref:mRNA-capping enzyme n=1 Tax=Dictyocaulus viviparus TaxID=29172 RepID=A0A0D8YBJ7_DICVI|nr:mRNA capping enzyme, catalytic domain protein [Dictyocaulus viviparus]
MSGPTLEKTHIGVPDRWMHCPKVGKIVDGLFLPFKTPLCALYDAQIEKKLRFYPEHVFNHPSVKGRKLGLWIDLTKTDRYYFIKEVCIFSCIFLYVYVFSGILEISIPPITGAKLILMSAFLLSFPNRRFFIADHYQVESHECIYRKIPLAGHGTSPTQEETDRFVRLVQGFVRDHPGEIVGVHCTHGFNRTGFLIAAYLVIAKDWAVDCAVLTFAKQRPCGIYKQDYLVDLFERYGDPDDCLEAPSKPSWEYGDALVYEDNSEASMTVKGDDAESAEKETDKPKGKQFMDGLVQGVVLVTDTLKKKMLQGKIKELCGAKRDGFPGLQPVSLERSRDNDNLKLLAQRPYMVSWKADGMRYMVYICDENEIYAFDRDNEVFLIQGLSFPHRKHPRHIVNTLVDAEMIIDHVKDEHGNMVDLPRLLIYDIIHLEDTHVGKENFDIRFLCIRRELIEPRNAAIKAGRIRKEREPMSVRVKDFWELEALPKLFEPKFTKNVGHEIDGLILQPVDAPYTSGRSDIVLKWKPPSHNSIDFKLQIRKVVKEGELPQHIGYLYVQNSNEPMATMKATKKLLPYDNKIIECTFENGQWIFMRERTDKSLPNSLKTAQSVYNSMVNPIDRNMLIEFAAKHGYKRRQEQLPPESKRRRIS